MALRFDNLSLNLRRRPVLRDASGGFPSASVTVILGANGAGKSTTIRCLMGFNKPTSGVITVFGQDMLVHPDIAKRQIGYLPGNVKLYDTWTGWDHIKFFERIRGKSSNIKDLISRFDFNRHRQQRFGRQH